MKYLIYISIIYLITTNSCSSTSPVTTNPDKTTATSGTIGSAKFTDAMPKKRTDTLPIQTDTMKLKRDSLMKKDSAR